MLGPLWVELFSASRLATTPAYRCEEVARDTWLVQLTPRLADTTDDHDAFVAVRAAAKEHLGADCFWDPQQRSRGRYRGADIPTLDRRGLA